jgi:peptidylprolyl isomerase
LPQSRHRKTGKGKKRQKGLYPATKSKPLTGRNRQVRIIAIVIVVVLAASAIAYLVTKRTGKTGTEVTTASGLKYIDLVEGSGPLAEPGKTVSVNYTGTLENGTVFDSSARQGKPYQFRLGTGVVIKGWDEGLMTMRVGGKRKLTIPPSLAYKDQRNGIIPPHSTLIFDVELLYVK